jgi:hypothetical protein
MDCLKSFTIHSSSNITAGASSTYVQNLNNYWVLDTSLTSSFIIEGFKNINIHGVELIGAFEANSVSNQRCIISDWGTTLQLQGGTIPQVSGRITASPNQWQIDNTTAFARLFTLGKYQNKVMFASPFESVKSIQFLNLNANGIGAESALVGVNLKWNLQWVFYYTYEGEQY